MISCFDNLAFKCNLYRYAGDSEDQRPPHALLLAPRAANLQREATLATPRAGVVTVDITPPSWDHGGPHGGVLRGGGGGGGKPTATAVTATDLTVSFGLSEPGEVFWVVVPEVFEHAAEFSDLAVGRVEFSLPCMS